MKTALDRPDTDVPTLYSRAALTTLPFSRIPKLMFAIPHLNAHGLFMCALKYEQLSVHLLYNDCIQKLVFVTIH